MVEPAFETTCPLCEHDFDVAADAVEATCPSCRAIIELQDDGSAKKAEQAALLAARQKERDAALKAKKVAQEKARKELLRKRQAQAAARADRQHARELARQARLDAKRLQTAAAEKQRAKDLAAKAKLTEAKKQDQAKLLAAKEKATAQIPATKVDASARDRFLQRNERTQGKSYDIEDDIEGIGPKFAEKLHAAGINSTDDLLNADGKALAQSTGISAKEIRKWQDMADLLHVAGIGKQYAEVLVRCDVNSVKELAQEQPGPLAARINAFLGGKKTTITKASIREKRVAGWIQGAAKLCPPPTKKGDDALLIAQTEAKATDAAKKVAAAKAEEKARQRETEKVAAAEAKQTAAANKASAKKQAASKKAAAKQAALEAKQARAAEKQRANAAAAAKAALPAKPTEPSSSARERFLKRNERTQGKSYDIEEDIEGIGPKFAEKLHAAGIHSTDDLLNADGKSLAESTGISAKEIRKWQDMADLLHVPGIGKQYAEVLVRCHVNSVKELAQEQPGLLAERINAFLGSKKSTITKASIREKRVAGWIQGAAKLCPPPTKKGDDALLVAQANAKATDAAKKAATALAEEKARRLEAQKEAATQAKALALAQKEAAKQKALDGKQAAAAKKAHAKRLAEAEKAATAAKTAAAKQAAVKPKADHEADAKAAKAELAVSQDAERKAAKAKAAEAAQLAKQAAAAKKAAQRQAAADKKANAAESKAKAVAAAEQVQREALLEDHECPHCQRHLLVNPKQRKTTCPKCKSLLAFDAPGAAPTLNGKDRKAVKSWMQHGLSEEAATSLVRADVRELDDLLNQDLEALLIKLNGGDV